jgi:hypothetical protein
MCHGTTKEPLGFAQQFFFENNLGAKKGQNNKHVPNIVAGARERAQMDF